MNGIIWFNQKEKLYFFQPHDIIFCKKCKREIEQVIVIRAEFYLANNKVFRNKLSHYCVRCFNKDTSSADLALETKAVIVEQQPIGCIQVVIRPPYLTDIKSGTMGFQTVFSAVNELNCDHVEDNTRHAGRESIHGAQIGSEEWDDGKDKPVLTDNSFDALMLDMKSSKPLITGEERKQIEGEII